MEREGVGPEKAMPSGGDRARPRVEPRGGATRCPYCHEECPPGEDVRVCRECLARHHAACWSESEGCAGCRAREALAPEKGPARPNLLGTVSLALGLASLVVVPGVAIFIARLAQTDPWQIRALWMAA